MIAVVFANPLFWVGMFALSLPLMVHLMTMRTPRIHTFPSLHFLRKAQASQSRWFRLRHLLLMLVRTLALLFLVFTFLRPLLESRPNQNPAAPGSIAAVILVDVSFSMRYQATGGTLLSRARLSAERILDDLPASALCNVIVVGTEVRPAYPELSANRFHLRQDLRQLQASYGRADWSGAIAEALRQLSETQAASRELHLVSDFQRSNWAEVDLGMVPEDIELHQVAVAPERPSNVFVRSVVLEPPAPTCNEPVRVLCTVAHRGTEAVGLPLKIDWGDGRSETRRISLQPGATTTETFHIQFAEVGVYEASVTLPDDALPGDANHFAIDVHSQLNVTLVNDEPEAAGGTRSIVRTAVQPFGAEDGYAACRVWSTAELRPLQPSRDPVVLLSGMEAMDAEARSYLLQYLNNGGSIVWMLKTVADANNLLALAESSAGELLLPFRPLRPLRIQAGSKPDEATIKQANLSHPLLKKFARAPDLSETLFTQYFATERIKGNGRVLARYGSGHVAIAEQAVGAGTLLLCNFSPVPSHSNLGRRMIFVPLLHEMIKHARPEQSAHSFLIGEACATTVGPLAEDQPLAFRLPDQQPVDPLYERRKDEVSVVFPPAVQPGFYRVIEPEGRLLGSVAANVDPREAETDYLDATRIRQLASANRALHRTDGTDLRALARHRHGTPLWPWCLFAVFLLLLLEQFLWRIGARSGK